MQKKITIYIIIIVVILLAVFFSQQEYSENIFKNIISYINKYAGASLMGGVTAGSENNNPSENNPKGQSSIYNDKNMIGAAFNSSSTQKPIDPVVAPTGIGGYIAKGIEAVSGVTGKMGETIKSGGEIITNSVNVAKENISTAEGNISDATKNATKNITDYFSGIKDSILHPGENNNCPPTPTN